jgi:hypothetical protein
MTSSDEQEREVQAYFDRVQETPEGQQRLARAAALTEIAQTHGSDAAMRLMRNFQAEHSEAPPAEMPASET